MKKKDYYEVLGISKNANASEIKSAYRSLAKKYHPDKNKDHDAEQKFKEINEAYEVLSDDAKKANYDKYGHDSEQQHGFNGRSGSPFGGGGFGSIFEEIFGGFGGGSTNSRRNNKNSKQQGSTKQAQITITFIESILGTELHENIEKYSICATCEGTGAESKNGLSKCNNCNGHGEIEKIMKTMLGNIKQVVICPKCNGQGKIIIKKCHNCKGNSYIKEKKKVNIKIPAGIKNGQSLVLKGFGGPGINGGPAGDLILFIGIKNHKYFIRQENDIFINLPISFINIINEAKIKVPTPYGIIEIKVPKSTKSGDIITIKGKGVKINDKNSGDLKIRASIYIPKLSTFEINQINDALKNNRDKNDEEFIKKVRDNK
ncbi:MAG: molecular chaperone DnaJ [Metamycoplasmataceae bacterium]